MIMAIWGKYPCPYAYRFTKFGILNRSKVFDKLLLRQKERQKKRKLSVVARDRGLRASISVDEELPRLVLDKMPRHQA